LDSVQDFLFEFTYSLNLSHSIKPIFFSKKDLIQSLDQDQARHIVRKRRPDDPDHDQVVKIKINMTLKDQVDHGKISGEDGHYLDQEVVMILKEEADREITKNRADDDEQDRVLGQGLQNFSPIFRLR
jgi:hypothetical protein